MLIKVLYLCSLAGKTFDAAITNQKKTEQHTGMKMANLFMAFMGP